MAIDVCYHLGTGSHWQNNELRYSLRAMERNFRDLGRVFVVGFRPKWLSNEAVYLDVPDRHRHSKDANLIDKILAACKAGASDLVVRSSDDELILIPCGVEDLKPYHAGTLIGKNFARDNGWHQRLLRTRDYLTQHGFPALHYDTHIPKVYPRDKFIAIAESCDYHKGIGYTIDTLFQNQLGNIDPPRLDGQKLTLEGSATRNASEIRRKIQGKLYLGYNDGGLTGALKIVLQELFPEPSRYENDRDFVITGIEYDDTLPIPMVVAVVGTGRSGTSLTAGILHHLGISMGRHLRAPSPANPRGFFEALPLLEICRERCSPQNRIRKFRRWAIERRKRDGDVIGCKYALLCHQIPEMVKAWPRLKIVSINRPLDEIVSSMVKARIDKPFDNPRAMERLAKSRITARDQAFAKLKLDVLHLEFSSILSDPAATIDALCKFTGISPTEEQRATALAFVDPSLRHNGPLAICGDYCQHRFTCQHSRDRKQPYTIVDGAP